MIHRFEDQSTGGGTPDGSPRPNAINTPDAVAALELLEPRLMLDGGPLITEFMASNGSTILDEDDDAPDWIEIYNPAGAAIDLGGWYLTDDADNLTKWRFPATPLSANDYLVVFASDKDRAVAGSELHTNFKLSAEGEYLGLVEPDGVTVAHAYDPEFPPQVRDVSYGLGLDSTEAVYIGSAADVRAMVPTDDLLDGIWMDPDWPDDLWESGTLGVGYDDATTFDPLIGLDVGPIMAGLNQSIYVRVDFTVDDPTLVLSLTLRMKYNDGFVAYINGELVASSNADVPSLTWNSGATAGRSISASITFSDYDLTAHIGELDTNDNVLAIHGLNRGATSSEMLILPELIGAVGTGTQELVERYFVEPTPGAPNAVGILGYADGVDTDVEHGFFEDPFEVALTCPTADATIVYTTDCSVPSLTNGTVYDPLLPIAIDTTTTLRTVAFKDGYNPSVVRTTTYIFLDDVLTQSNDQTARGFPEIWHAGAGGSGIFDSEYRDGDYEVDPDIDLAADDLLTIPSMSLVMEQGDLWDSYLGIYPNSIKRASSNLLWERPASLELIEPDGGGGFSVNAGARITGEAARWAAVNDKQSFRIVFKGEYGPPMLETDFFGDEDVNRYDTIILRSHWGNSFLRDETLGDRLGVSWLNGDPTDAQYLRDIYAHDAYADTGNLSVSGRFVNLYLNGLYWGLYEIIERPDNSFNAEHLGGDKDDYDVLKGSLGATSVNGLLVDGQRDTWTALMSYFDTNPDGSNIDGQVTPVSDIALAEIGTYMDLTSFADYMITLWTIGRYDFPRKNWYAVCQRGELGQPPMSPFRFYTWDSEASLSSIHANPGGGWSNPSIANDTGPVRMYRRLRLNATFRRLWMDRVQKHFFNEGALTPEASIERYTERTDEIDRAIIGESARWGDWALAHVEDPVTRDDWVEERDWLVEQYFPQRSESLLGYMLAQDMWTDLAAPEFNQRGGEFDPGFQLILTNPNASGTIWYTLDGTDPRDSVTAIEYTAPLTLTDITFVRAAVHDVDEWSPLDEAGFIPVGGAAFTITEVMYNPPDLEAPGVYDAEDYEFVELANFGATAINLQNVLFADGIGFDFAGSPVTQLQPSEYVVIVKNQAAFESRYGLGINIAGVYIGSLNSDGETIAMTIFGGFAFQSFTYDDSGAWPGRADGKGASLELADPAGDRNDPDTWRSSSEYLGSPGEAGAGPLKDVVVNEVLTHTHDILMDTIELHNTTAAPINIGGWFLSDTWTNYKKYKIPADTTIPAGGYILFDETHFNASALTPDPADDNPNDFGLSGAHGDDVWLMEAGPAEVLTRFVDHVDFDAAALLISHGRWPNGTGDLFPMQTMTLGGPNSGPRFGPMVISEVMYNPGPQLDDLEFIEIHNPTAATVDLSGWRLDKGVDFTFRADAALEPDARLVVLSFNPARPDNAMRLEAFRTAYGIDETVVLVGGWSGKLDNGGERVQLQRPDDPPLDELEFTPHVIVDEVDYDDEDPWPIEPDGQGPSLHRASPAAWGNDPASWTVAPPTPGSPMARPGDADLDGDIDLDDFVILKKNFGLSGMTWADADFDGDGKVGLDDFVLLKQNFATAATTPPAGAVSVDATADTEQADSPAAQPVNRAMRQLHLVAAQRHTAPAPVEWDQLITLTRVRGRQLAAAAKAATTGELVDLLDGAQRILPL